MKQFSARQFGLKLLFVFLFLSGVSAVFAAGDIDPTFNASAYGSLVGPVHVFKRQPDGKILVGGNFYDLNGVAASGLARLNSDYTVDTTFHPPDFGDSAGIGGTIRAIGLQTDGKIIVGGTITSVDGVASSGLKRLFPNGTLDTSFQPPSVASNFIYHDIEVLSDGKILAGGQRLNPDGSVDNTFTTIADVYITELQPDGKILAVVNSFKTFRRYNSDGTVDTSFSPSNAENTIFDIEYLGDGKIMIGGFFGSLNGTGGRILARLHPNGVRDTSFSSNGSGFNSGVKKIIHRGDGKFWVAGDFSTYNDITRRKVALINPDGSLDESFPGTQIVSAVNVQDFEAFPDGKMIIGYHNQSSIDTLLLYNPDGTVDVSNRLIASRGGRVNHITQLPDGKILMVGQFKYANGTARWSVARLNLDGTLDTSFTPSLPNWYNVNKVAVQPDGNLMFVIEGSPGTFRMHPNGAHDPSFFAFQISTLNLKDITILPDGKMLVCGGNASDARVYRLQVNGPNDGSFINLVFNGMTNRMIVLPDGKILVAGTFTQVGTTPRGRIARLNADGTLDNTFNPAGGANGEITDMQLLADGKIMIGGAFTEINGNANQNRVARLNADGSLDTSFAQNLVVNNTVTSVAVQADGKVIVGGNFSQVGGGAKLGLAKFNANGSLDSSFSPYVNFPASVSEVYLQTDGKILVGGQFTKMNGQSHVRIARLFNESTAPRVPFDYDGDGKADVSVFRPAENKWYILQSSNNAVVQTVFAVAGDIPVPSDYDGDGKTDIGIFRPSTGDWWYLSSINDAQVNVNWGQAGDIPRPSDFDGDGKTDFVVYRPSNSVWYRFGTTGITSNIAFGIAEDKSLVGDFDGDGKSDPAIFRPSTGDWWYASSINGQFAVVHWGQAGDIPVPGDYDADGKTDFVVYRPSNGGWYILRSGEQNYTILQFGIAEDKPVAADYDGDGKADVAVWRPSTGTWYLLQTTAGFGAVQWGTTGDVPTENAFVP